VHILGATVTLSDIHCEGHADCVFFDKYGGGSAQGVYGHRTITNNVHIGPNTSGIVILGAFGNSAKVNILDEGMHQSIATNLVALYATSSTSSTGLLMQRNTLKAGAQNGGLFMLGNGRSSSHAVAEIGGGFTSDAGTYTARSETPEADFTPNVRLRLTPLGAQILPSPSDPGCSSPSDTGRLWVSGPYSTAAVKICLYGGSGTWVWKTMTLAP
jgi:hypothetical protein